MTRACRRLQARALVGQLGRFQAPGSVGSGVAWSYSGSRGRIEIEGGLLASPVTDVTDGNALARSTV